MAGIPSIDEAVAHGEVGCSGPQQRRVDSDCNRRFEEKRSTERLSIQKVQRPCDSKCLHDGHDDAEAEQSDLVGQIFQRGKHTPTDRFIERLETSGKLSFPRASSDGSTEPVVPRTSREHLATSNRSVDLGGTSVAEYRKQQLVVDDYQVGELLHSEVGISLGDSDQSTLVATVALPFGNHRACLVSEHRLQRSNLTGRQLPRGGGTGTTALNNPSEVRIK